MAESNKKTFDKITAQEIKANGIQALANRPNKVSQYGQSGLSASELKLWFDKLTSLIADRVNGIAEALEGENAAKYISVVLPEEFAQLEINTLYELIESIYNGEFASILNVPIDSSNSSLESRILNILTSLSEVSSTASEAKDTADDAKETVDGFEDDLEDFDERLEEYYDTFANATLTYNKEKSQLVYTFVDHYGYHDEKKVDLPIKDLEHRLDQLESATLQFTEDSSIAYEKIVPANSAKYALVNKVGGMTYKNNINNYLTLLRVEWNDTSAEVTINADNSITIDKQGDDSGWVSIVYQPEDEKVEGRYFTSLNDIPANISNIVINSSYVAVDEDENYYDGERSNELNSWIPSGDYYRNEISTIIFYLGDSPMKETFSLILTDTDDIWQGLRDAKVTELVSEGANLLPRAWTNTQTVNGVTFTVQEDNSIIVNGTATAEATFSILRGKYKNEFITIEKGETYTLSGCPEGGSGETYRFVVQNTSYSQNYNDTGDGVTDIAKFTDYYAYISIKAGYTANNLVFKPMFVRGSVARPYSPYGTIVDTFPISAELRAFLEDKGYSRGVSGYPNYIDFERKVFSNNRHIFGANLSDYNLQGQISAVIPINALAEDYRAVSCDATWVDKDMAYGNSVVGYKRIDIVDNRYTDAETFRQAVSGKKLIYALAEPIETDISAYLTDDNFIEVEAGGTIKAVNTYELDAPTTIAYVSQKGS